MNNINKKNDNSFESEISITYALTCSSSTYQTKIIHRKHRMCGFIQIIE